MRFALIRTLGIVLGGCVYAHAALAIAAFSAEYAVTTRGLPVGVMTRTLTAPEPGRYRLEATVTARGLAALLGAGTITELSEGALIDERPRPSRYEYRRAGGKRERSSRVTFDWDASRIDVEHKDRTTSYPAQAGLLDKLAYQLALVQDLPARPAALTYSVADAGGIKDYALAIEDDSVTLPSGERVSALKVEYRRADTQRRTTLWCAAAYDYQPVRIEYREDDGETTVAELTRLRD